MPVASTVVLQLKEKGKDTTVGQWRRKGSMEECRTYQSLYCIKMGGVIVTSPTGLQRPVSDETIAVSTTLWPFSLKIRPNWTKHCTKHYITLELI